jgi:uncharacterized membrane protein YqgA involved in biofilm formation
METKINAEMIKLAFEKVLKNKTKAEREIIEKYFLEVALLVIASIGVLEAFKKGVK